ncbi:MAG: hypothetical protein AAGI34_19590 [Pseudomonadota bacterium]
MTADMATLWPYLPREGIEETLEWLTGIQGSRAGEQRRALRRVPREYLRLNHIHDDATADAIRAAVRANFTGPWVVPHWGQALPLGPLTATDTALAIPVTLADFRVGEDVALAALGGPAKGTLVTRTVAAIDESTLTLAAPAGLDAPFCRRGALAAGPSHRASRGHPRPRLLAGQRPLSPRRRA